MQLPTLTFVLVLLGVHGGLAADDFRVSYTCLSKDSELVKRMTHTLNADSFLIDVEEISFQYCAMLCASTPALYGVSISATPWVLYAARTDEENKNKLLSECWCSPEGSQWIKNMGEYKCNSTCPDNSLYPCTAKDTYIGEHVEITEPIELEGYTLVFNSDADEKARRIDEFQKSYEFGKEWGYDHCIKYCQDYKKCDNKMNSCRAAHYIPTTQHDGKCNLYRNIRAETDTDDVISDILTYAVIEERANNDLYLRSPPYITQPCNKNDQMVCSLRTPGAICDGTCVCPETHYFKLDHCEPKQ